MSFRAKVSVTYPGGKNGAGVPQTLINLMPPHETYVEPFLGGGAVMRLKRPAKLNIGIDLDAEVVEVWGAGRLSPDAPGEWRFECRDALEFLKTFPFAGNELVYCDPPYLLSTRSSGRLYRHEMTDAQHAELLDVVGGLKCFVMISGYSSALYAKKLKGWHATAFQTTTRGGKTVAEWVWCNYPRPTALHDYRFLGDDFRERANVRRQQKRWTAKLANMPVLQRQALLSAIADTAGFGATAARSLNT